MAIPILQMRRREPGELKGLPEATLLLSGEQGLDHESRDSSGEAANAGPQGMKAGGRSSQRMRSEVRVQGLRSRKG